MANQQPKDKVLHEVDYFMYNLFSDSPCYIDKLPTIRQWYEDGKDEEAPPYPGAAEATAQFLEDCNYHDFVSLPYAFRTIVACTPMTPYEKQKLLERLCTALYNFDILRGAE